jgi:hypothetical protein
LRFILPSIEKALASQRHLTTEHFRRSWANPLLRRRLDPRSESKALYNSISALSA